MREILFRGRRIDNKEWVEGFYFEGFTGIPYILTMHDHILGMAEYYKVDPATVGQFTGLYDKHGNRIFEGNRITNTHLKGTVKFFEGCFYIHWDNQDEDYCKCVHLLDYNRQALEVLEI